MPELSEEIISEEDIKKYVEALEENEKRELEKCFYQLTELYKRYNCIDSLAEEMTLKLKSKYYGLFAKYCKNFKYINEDVAGLATARNIRDTIIYKNQNNFVLDDPEYFVEDDSLFRFDKNTNQMGNVFLLISELSHSIQKDVMDKDTHFYDDVDRAKDSIKKHIGVNMTAKEKKLKKEELYSHFMYRDASFIEFKAHKITERAVYFYLLDRPNGFEGKSFEEIYKYLGQIYESFMKSTYIGSNKEKAEVLSAILKPGPLEYILKNKIKVENVGKLLNNLDFEVLLNYN